jgi:hypothetical protein
MQRVILVCVALLFCARANAERLTNPALGLSIEKPDDWCNLAASDITKDHRLIGMNYPALEQAIRKYPIAPVFAFFRCRTGRDGVAATVKVETQPADPSGQESAPHALRAAVGLFSKLVGDVKVATPPETVTLAGRPSAYSALTFTLRIGAKPYSVASELWAIPQGKYFILVGTTYAANDGTGARAAIMNIVNSLELAHWSAGKGGR